MDGKLTRWEVMHFVYHWFKKITEKAPQNELVEMIVDKDLNMVFPESTLKSHDDFKKWLNDVTSKYFDQVHDVKMIHVDISGNRTSIDLIVNWEAHAWNPPDAFSDFINLDIHQTWRVEKTSDPNSYGGLRIKDYIIKEAMRNH